MANEPTTRICSTHLGARGELIACSWLLGLGYEVFRNVSGVGPADIAIWSPCTGEHHLVDVKAHGSSRLYSNGTKTVPFNRPRHERVLMLLVVDGEVAGFFRQKPNRLPARYWPLNVNAPDMPSGYNEDDESTDSHMVRTLEWNGRHMSISELARESGLSSRALRHRLSQGIPLEIAVSFPAGNGGHNPPGLQQWLDKRVTSSA